MWETAKCVVKVQVCHMYLFYLMLHWLHVKKQVVGWLFAYISSKYACHCKPQDKRPKVRRGCESPSVGIILEIRILTIHYFLYSDVNKRTDNSFQISTFCKQHEITLSICCVVSCCIPCLVHLIEAICGDLFITAIFLLLIIHQGCTLPDAFSRPPCTQSK